MNSKFLAKISDLVEAEAVKAGVAVYIETDNRGKLPKLTIWERVNLKPDDLKQVRTLPSGTRERKSK